MPACRYMKQNGLAAMPAAKRSAVVAQETNLREHVTHIYLYQAQVRLPTFKLLNPEETSPEVQNRGFSGPTKKDLCPPKKL